MRYPKLVLLALLASACGEDAPPPAPPKPPPGAPGAPKGKPGAAPKQLQARMHVEERVTCPPIEKGTGPPCKPETAACEPGLYCLPVGDGKAFHCESCPERDSIRHDFKDRDFVVDQVRDPFQSYIMPQKGLEDTSSKKVDGPCTRPEQFVAANYSYLDLRLVGIVAQGTQRKVLMMDRGNFGHIIRRGDCVGKEKAVVKDIGPGFVTFVVHPDPQDKTPNRIPEERSIQLHPKGLQVAPQPPPEAMAPGTSAPIVAPPGGGTPAPTVPPPAQ